ncbi:MAG: type II toxin-antitoxin system RelE/ParE family toxin [Cyanothece sp. SIO1E1]|nr:type II toxin-antitoxin system RelE/ParE family toxin [Cyanothece sp. SIO1E1]
MPRSHPLSIELAPEAELDIIDILQYTQEYFGERQKDIYKQWLTKAINRIARTPEFGKAIKISGYCRYHISWAGNRGRHYIYYRVVDDSLEIARILHDSRNYLIHFPFDDD